ncbi:DUF3794 and LysM peptidoglycan-binding domain-containing protein [Inediibacterium massiliense]|uniref:DUF3794 and LysM peptidoglycan-binding domain-containing protein n=1 Tax=Inediibacterium massiliense TaxID=1658111 RepID=UPI0006B405E3|nr:SPOCS domain-containing protein [Inediibacterium massiliense]
MAMELMRDLLKIDQVIGGGDTQALVEGEILVPDIKPDISRIISVDGDISITGKEILKDKVNIEGVINFKILYVADTGEYPVYGMNASAGFNQSMDIPATEPNMRTDIRAFIEHIDSYIVNERKIGIKAVVDLEGKSMDTTKMEVLRKIEGLEDVQVLKENIYYEDLVGSNQSETMVREKIEIDESMPDILEIVKCDAYPVEKERQVTDGKVIVGGVVKINTLYVGDDEKNSLCIMRNEVPFTHFVEIPNAMKDMESKIKLKGDEVYTEIKENVDGDKRIVEVEAVIKIDAVVSEIEQNEVLVDAYSPTKVLKIDKKPVFFYEKVGDNTANVIVKEMLDIPDDALQILKVLHVNARPVMTDMTLNDEKVIIEGVLETNVLYLCQDEEKGVKNFAQEIPFRHFVEIPKAKENMEAEVELHTYDIDYSLINPEQIEVRINIGANCTVKEKMKIEVIVDAQELDEKVDMSKRPSITIYYVQPGDTIWKIAKRYNTTVEELIETNHIEKADSIYPGDQIVIQKTFVYEF